MQFYERDEKALQGEKDALDKRDSAFGVNADMLYLLPGTTQVRLLPPYSDKGVFFKEISKHRIKNGKRWETYACPLEMASLPCALCELGAELTATLDEAKIEFVSENLRPRTAFLYNVICHGGPQNRKNETPEFGKVYCLESGLMVHKQILQLDQDPVDGWADITTVNNGVNLTIKRTGQGLGTEYSVNPHGSGRTDIFEQLVERGIDPAGLVLFDLDNVYTLPTEEKLELVTKMVKASVPKVQPVQAMPIPVAASLAATPLPAATSLPAAAPAAPIPTAMPLAQPIAAPVPVAAVAAAVGGAPAEEEVPAPPAIPAPPTE